MANVSFQRAQAKFQPGLTGFTRGAGSGTFQYDPLGRRTRKIVSGTTRRFHYDGVTPVQELDGAGNILANLLTGLGIDEYFTRSGSPGTRTLLGDALNSTLALADDTGAIQTTYTVAADDELAGETPRHGPITPPPCVRRSAHEELAGHLAAHGLDLVLRDALGHEAGDEHGVAVGL